MLFQDCGKKRRPSLSPPKAPVLGQAGPRLCTGERENQQSRKGVKNITSLTRARRWSSFNRGCCCLSPTHTMPVEGKLQTHSGTESSTGSSKWQQLPHSVFLRPHLTVVSLFALSWGCPRHFCWTLRSPDLMLCDLKLLFICHLLSSFTFACCVLNSFTHWKLKEWQWQLILWTNITFPVCAFAMVWVYVPLRFEDDFRKPTIFLLLWLWWLEYTRTLGHRTKVQQQFHCCAILMLNKTYTRMIKC